MRKLFFSLILLFCLVAWAQIPLGGITFAGAAPPAFSENKACNNGSTETAYT